MAWTTLLFLFTGVEDGTQSLSKLEIIGLNLLNLAILVASPLIIIVQSGLTSMQCFSLIPITTCHDGIIV